MGIIEILKSFADLVFMVINSFFNFEVDLYHGVKIKFGILVIGFLAVIYTIYFVLKALKIIGDDN